MEYCLGSASDIIEGEGVREGRREGGGERGRGGRGREVFDA